MANSSDPDALLSEEKDSTGRGRVGGGAGPLLDVRFGQAGVPTLHYLGHFVESGHCRTLVHYLGVTILVFFLHSDF